jgi:hypothetical protein
MKTSEVIEFYGSQSAVAEALGIKQPSVANWDEFPPHYRQIQIQAISGGKLRAEPEAIDKLLGVKPA